MSFQLGLYKAKFKSAILRETINKLTLIRIYEYDKSQIQQEIQEKDFRQIPVLISELSEKIQKINIIRLDGPVSFRKTRKKFNELLNNTWYEDKFHAIKFAAQLLQYYTIVCDDAFKSESSFIQFQQFLDENEDKFGTVTNSLFITEYTLIKIYNDLSEFDEVYKDIGASDDKLNNSPDFPVVGKLCNALKELEPSIAAEVAASPDNIFLQYLNFIHSYTAAKATEIQYKLQAVSTIEAEPTEWIEIQRKQLNKAKTALHTMETLFEQYDGKKDKTGSGLEYSLGQNVLHHFPEKNLNDLEKHVSALLLT